MKLVVFNVNVNLEIFLVIVQISILLAVGRRFHYKAQCAFTQLAHNIAATLLFFHPCCYVSNVVFPASLLRLKSNVATTLCFQRRFYDPKLTLLQRFVFDFGYSVWYMVAKTLLFCLTKI